MPGTALPSVRSFLIADSVFRQDNGKWCVIGIFDRIMVRSFPAWHHALGVFLELGDVPVGKHVVNIALIDSEDRQLAMSPPLTIEVKDRLANIGVGFQTYGLQIPQAGTYFVSILFNNERLDADIRLQAIQIMQT
jgi:hypothetical protein